MEPLPERRFAGDGRAAFVRHIVTRVY